MKPTIRRERDLEYEKMLNEEIERNPQLLVEILEEQRQNEIFNALHAKHLRASGYLIYEIGAILNRSMDEVLDLLDQ